MARPIGCHTVGARRRLKRVARSLLEHPRPVHRYRMPESADKFDIYIHSDWAGDEVWRKNTSVVYLFLRRHLRRSSSSAQSVIALSDGLLSFTQFARECHHWYKKFGERCRLANSQRCDADNIRHIQTLILCVHRQIFSRAIVVRNIAKTSNVADFGTSTSDTTTW